ncbi:UDP-N-acetylglucosamine--N-acetylmuramyl-(pentapeptide) pyrophosphoryl-undecaprenol N-acetylglucosamine transferase [Branchiibius cervicis]|uniref:UDP-N-acetylglucosamine--N-acetylmuramyl-(pentapeptide) pyrophosphoryl-undecaprenol N-acetylglucosamine transferase n=1 Tax=Branchiibius cervicis TaxID=908252 RepID=A0ABW2AR94_9MICO
MTDAPSVVLAGGGTAGHISPLLATAEALLVAHPDARITVLGSHGGLEERIVPAAGFDLRLIPKAAFPRRPDLDAVRFPARLRRAVRTTRDLLHEVDADAVVGFGGFVSPPAFLAARRAGVPIVVHEGNAMPGMATKLGARLTDHVATTFHATDLPHATRTGMPLRQQITSVDRAALRPEALARYGLADDRATVLVTGGSLGAKSINDAFAGAVRGMRAAGIQVLHITGRGKEFDPGAGAGADPAYVVVPYADRMELAYAVADLVVTRAGGNMVCEVGSLGLPAVFVPLPHGNGEQRLNAADAVEAGAAVLVPDEEFTAAWISANLPDLVRDSARLAAMSDAAAGQGHQHAAAALVAMIDEAIGERSHGVR